MVHSPVLSSHNVQVANLLLSVNRVETESSGQKKLKTLVYDILPPTNAIIDYAVGLLKTFS